MAQWKTTQYLDATKRALGIESDYALAKHLGLTQQAISKLRVRGAVMSNTTAVKVAQIIKWDPLTVIADCELERGSSPEIWKKLRDAAVVAALAIGAASFGVVPQPAQAAGFNNNGIALPSAPAPTSARDVPEIHIVRQLRRAGRALLAFLIGLVGVAL